MGGLSIARGLIGGIAGAAGDPQTQQDMVVANQQAAVQKQNKLKASLAPLQLGAANLQKGIQTAYSQFQQQNPDWKGDFEAWKTGPGSQQFGQFTDQMGGVVHSMRELVHPDYQAGPTDWLKTHLTDRMHITNADHRADDQANQAAWNQYDEKQFTNKATNVTPWDESPAVKQEKLKNQLASGLISQKGAQDQTLEGLKTTNAQTIEGMKANSASSLEDKKAALQSILEDKKTSEQTKIELMKMQIAAASNERIERMHNAGQGAIGTWQSFEGPDGKMMLFNTKTREQADAPVGMHKTGYYAKQVAPIVAASKNIDEYINAPHDGPGDLDLQHQYFMATAPPTGFRMTGAQQKSLKDAQSLENTAKAAWAHITGGTIYSDEQRMQIANEAKRALDAKKKALAGEPQDFFEPMGGAKTQALAAGAQNAAAGPQRKVGDKKTFPNGKTGVWDGTGYVAQ